MSGGINEADPEDALVLERRRRARALPGTWRQRLRRLEQEQDQRRSDQAEIAAWESHQGSQPDWLPTQAENPDRGSAQGWISNGQAGRRHHTRRSRREQPRGGSGPG